MYKHLLANTKFKRRWPAKISWLYQRGSFRKFVHYIAGTALIACVVAANLAIHPRAGADGIDAQHVLGQSNFSDGLSDAGGSVSANGLDGPTGSAYDSAHHRLFVVDENNNRVLVYDTTSGVTDGMPAVHVLGQSNFSDNTCNITQTNMCDPTSLTYDSTNNRLFVSDGQSNRVLVYDLSGGITDGMPAAHVLGQSNFSGFSCSGGSDTDICFPGGLAYDSADSELFVADFSNDRVLEFDLSGGITDGMAAVHILGQTGECTVTQTTMCNPIGLAYDAANKRLFVSDLSNDRVLEFDLSGGITDGMPASHVLGQASFTAQDCIVSQTDLCAPGGISYDGVNQRLFVVDDGNQRIMVYDLSGGITDYMDAADVIGQQDFTSSNSTCYSDAQDTANQNSLCNPLDVTYDAADNTIWVVDTYNNRVLEFGLGMEISTSKLPVGSINVSYSSTVGAEFGQAPYTFSITAGSLPAGLSLDPSTGEISGTPTTIGMYNFTVHVVDNNGATDTKELSIIVGHGSYDANGLLGQPNYNVAQANHANPSASSISFVSQSLVDPTDHLLFVADEYSNRILVYNLNSNGTPVDSTADYVIGQPDFTSSACATLCGPIAMAIDTIHHHLYVVDGSDLFDNNFSVGVGRVQIFSLNSDDTPNGSGPVFSWGDTGLNHGCGFSVADPEPNTMCDPDGIAVDATNHILYLSDTQYNRVLGFDLDSNNIPIDNNADYVIGQADFTHYIGNEGSESFSRSASTLYEPLGIALDPVNHKLYVADSFNVRILGYQLNSTNRPVDDTADYVIGEPDFTTGDFYSGCASVSADCLSPEGLTVDSAQHILYASDGYSSRILGYQLNSDGSPVDGTADYVLGATDFVGTTTCTGGVDNPNDSSLCGGGQFGNNQPSIDTVNHRLFVDDGRRVVAFNLNSSDIPPDRVADYVIGQPDFTSFYYNDVVAPNADGLSAPSYTAVDTVGHHLYVSDNINNRVQVYNLDSTDHIASGTPAYSLDAPFPESLTVDGTNHILYVSDSNGVDGFNLDANNLPLDDTPDYNIPGDYSGIVQLDLTDHYLYVGGPDDPHNITVYQLNSNDSLPASPFTFDMPTNLEMGVSIDFMTFAVDTVHHQLYVSVVHDGFDEDGFKAQIMVTSLEADNVTQTADYPLDFVDTACGLYGGSGAQTITEPCTPEGLAIDPNNHRLFVADDANSRILVYDLDDNDLPLDSVSDDVIGQPDFTDGYCNQSAGAAPSQTSQCAGPGGLGITYDPTSYQLFVPDAANNIFSGNLNNRVLSYEFAHITTISLPDVATGSAYSQPVDETGSEGLVSYSLQGGSLPPGLGIDSATGLLSGTPTASGLYNFTIGLADNNGIIGIFNDAKVLSLNITSVTPPVTPPVIPPTTPPTTPPAKPPVTPPVTPPTTPPTTPPPVDLDNLPPGTTDVCGPGGDASVGQVYNFTARDGTGHTVTVEKIGPDYIQIDIDGLPTTLHVGDKIAQDIDGDGKPDICIDVISITGGNVEIEIARIILASTPNNTGTGGGIVSPPPSHPHKGHSWSILKFIFPWLLFILLGLSVLRLSYQSYQERRLAGQLNRQLELERSLAEEKENFITLSSHYLRTPMALISNGIDLMASLQGSNPTTEELKSLSQRLNLGVNSLLYQSGNIASGQTTPAATDKPAPILGGLQSLAAGFVQISSMPAIVAATAATLVIIGITDFILSKVDIYNVSLVTLLIQIAGVLLLGILLVAGLRSYNKRKALRQEAQALLDNQRRLDSARNQVIKAGLDSLTGPLQQLKDKLQTLVAGNPKVVGPALEGAKRLDGLMQKFVILTSLEYRTMGVVSQPTSLTDTLQKIQARYSAPLQARGLTINTNLQAENLQQDPLLTTFLLDSLINNAIKYSAPNQAVTVSSYQHGERVHVDVQDNGQAVPQDKLNQLFQPFSRAENVATDFNQQGVGLSLYLDKLIAGYLGGDISLHSDNQSTIASFSLPAWAEA